LGHDVKFLAILVFVIALLSVAMERRRASNWLLTAAFVLLFISACNSNQLGFN